MQFVSFSNRPVRPDAIQNGLFLFDSGTDISSIKTIDDWYKQAFNCFALTMTVTSNYIQSGPVRNTTTPVVLHKIPIFGVTSTVREYWQRWTLFEDSYAYGRGNSVPTDAKITSGQIKYFLVPPTITGQISTGKFTTYKYEASGSIAGLYTTTINVNTLSAMPSKTQYSGSDFGNYRSVSGNFYITTNNAWGIGAFSNFQFGSAAVTSVSKDSGYVENIIMTGAVSGGSSYCTWMGAVRISRRKISGAANEYEMIVLKRGEDYADNTSTGPGVSKTLNLNLKSVLDQKFFLDAPVVKL